MSCQFFDVLKHHFWYPFWNPILGPDLPKKQQDEPKRAIRSFKDQKTAFSKPLKKHLVFTRFWVQRPPKRASRGPRRLQRGTQRAPKPKEKLKKNARRKPIYGRKCLGPAISVFRLFGTHSGTQNWYFFWSFFEKLLITFWKTSGNHFGSHSGTKSAQDGPRWAQESH